MEAYKLVSHQYRQDYKPARRMSDVSIGSLKYISREDLSKRLLAADDSASAPASIVVVDVRDSDHIGGHIKGSIHAPTPDLDWKMPELVRTLKDKDTVVFHCALSQVRGPKAALEYLRTKERLEGGEGTAQNVVVLRGGFSQWQEKYGVPAGGWLTEPANKHLF
jgi:rhodanese-related sulfurtransferase